jgi:RHS repeat-associated protein
MTYDLNGSTLNDGTNSYVWDARNRLASADGSGASFSYDPLGRRVSKTVLSTTTNFLYDGANAVQEFGTNPTANLLTGGVDERFQRASSTETDDYLTDALGSAVELTGSTGATEEQYSYSPFGSQSASGGATTNSYTYTGREFDGLGIDYYRARYYNPTTGRFLSEDPMGFGGGINLYSYAANNPVSLRDSFGLDPGNGGNNPINGALSAFGVAAAAVIPTLSGDALNAYEALETQEIAVIGKLANMGAYELSEFNTFFGSFLTPEELIEANLEWVANVIEQEMPVIIASDLTEANLLANGGLTLDATGFLSSFGEELSMFLQAGYEFAVTMEADEMILMLVFML